MHRRARHSYRGATDCHTVENENDLRRGPRDDGGVPCRKFLGGGVGVLVASREGILMVGEGPDSPVEVAFREVDLTIARPDFAIRPEQADQLVAPEGVGPEANDVAAVE